MKCNTILKELSAQLFAVLLVTLCISISNVSKSYAITLEEWVEFVEPKVSTISNTNQRMAMERFFNAYHNNSAIPETLGYIWEDKPLIGFSTQYTDVELNARNCYFQFKDFPEGTKLVKNSSQNWADTPRITFTEVIFKFKNTNEIYECTTRQVTNNTQVLNSNTGNWCYTIVSDEFLVYSSSNSDSVYSYYFNDILTHGPKFTKSVHDVVFYENTTVSLGTLQGDYEKSKLQFLLYDVTDPNNLYPPLIAKYGNGISVLGSRVDLESRLVQVGHQYDLYFLYEGETTEQFRYVWRNFMNESGEIIGGYNIQTGVNQLIDYQTSGNQQIISAIESGNKEIINAVNNANDKYWGKSGDLNGVEQEQQIEQMINNISNTMSGELHNNEVFQILETAENGFFDYFRTQHEEDYYDLIIKWPNIKTGLTIGENNQSVDKLLISGDQINISAMCRNIPALKTTRDYLRIIINFMITVSILKQIYNLILGTLGIDNPYLYEDPGLEVEHYEDLDTGLSYNTYRGVGLSGNRYTLRRDTTYVKPKRRIGF